MDINTNIGDILNETIQKTPQRSKLINRITKTTKFRERQDIKKWRDAVQIAESVTMPDRGQLMKTYDDVMIDCHVNGIIESFKKITEGTKFHILDSNNEANEDEKKKFEKAWFVKYVSYIIDSLFYGYSLVQFCDIVDDTFKDVKLIPREYVIPDWDVIKKNNARISSPKDGVSWLMPPYNRWVIMIDTGTLGLLNIASPHAIAKKNLFNSAWEYADLFGIPIRMGFTDLSDPDRRKNMELMLDEMGSAAWGSFSHEDKIELVEGQNTDVHKVFLEPINASNREISKGFAGQTMMFEDGSSYSQSQVHENLFDMFLKSVLRKVQYDINEQLIPLMQLHGLVGDIKFEWMVEERLSTLEKTTIIKDLSPYYFFTPEFVSSYLNIDVESTKGIENENNSPESVLSQVSNLYKDAI